MHLVICSMFFSFKNLTKILDKANDVEPNYTDDSTCIQEAENETCAARWTSDIYWNVKMIQCLYTNQKHSNCMTLFVCIYVYSI